MGGGGGGGGGGGEYNYNVKFLRFAWKKMQIVSDKHHITLTYSLRPMKEKDNVKNIFLKR